MNNTLEKLPISNEELGLAINNGLKLHQIAEDEGLLTILNEAFTWENSPEGYNYWWEIAHREYQNLTEEGLVW